MHLSDMSSLKDNLAVLSAAKSLVSAVAGVLLVLGVTVSPALLLVLPPVIAAAYGLYRSITAKQAGAVAVALATPAPGSPVH